MSHPYSRILRNQDQTEQFLTEVLKFDYRELPKIISKIVNGEKGLIDYDISAQTLTSTEYRDRDYKDSLKRWDLWNQIIEELFTLERVENDDDIRLGKGGALPKCGIQKQKKAFLVTGLPASGKSSIANRIAEKFGAIIIDSDYAKRKLPEYGDYPCGATLVHEESDAIVSAGFESPKPLKSVFQRALLEGYNMVIPKIGHNPKSLISLAESLQSVDYEVHLILISLTREEATKRAIKRLHDTERYVPLGLIFDGYSNDPLMAYYLLRAKYVDLFKSFGAVSTVDYPAVCIDYLRDTPCLDYEQKLNTLF